MNYSLAAPKLMCGHLKLAHLSPDSSPPTMALAGILFQRVWLQGVLVSVPDDDRVVLDDGTGVIDLLLSNTVPRRDWKPGMYIMVVGIYAVRGSEPPVIRVHKMVDLSSFPDREAMWHLEVIEAFKLFYQSSTQE